MRITEELKMIPQRFTILPYLLAVKELRGVSSGVEEMSFDDIVRHHETKTGNQMVRAFTLVAKFEVLVVRQNFNAAKSLLLSSGDLRPFVPGFFQHPRYTILEGLIALKAAQTENTFLERRRWKKRAMKSIKLLRGMAKKGNVNVVHMLHLLTAELASLEGKKKKTEENFKAAISVAAKNGFMQDRALSHELAGQYFAMKGDKYWTDFHKENAVSFYSEWGVKG